MKQKSIFFALAAMLSCAFSVNAQVTTEEALKESLTTGGKVTLGADIELTETLNIPAEKTITLDLNGKTISQTKACTASYEMIKNLGILTIKNGTLSFTDTSAGDPSFGWGSYTINNYGTLVVEEGATIQHLGAQAFATHMIAAIQQAKGSTTINGGVISTPNYRSVRINGGALAINGGEFDGQVWLQPNQGDVTIAVNGGTFGPNGLDGSSIFMTNVGENKTVTSASITGGTFTTKIGCSDPAALAGIIKGGKFTETAKNGTNAALLATGLVFGEADANGYYDAVEDDPNGGAIEAKIGEQGYATLQAAVNAVQDGETITLVDNVTISAATAGYTDGTYTDGVRYTGDKSFTVDFNGKTVTDDGCVNDYLIYINNKGEKASEITFTNGTIVSANGCWSAVCVNSSAATQNVKLNLNGMNITNSNDAEYSGNPVVRVRTLATVNVNDGTIITSNGASYGVAANTDGSTVNINEGATIVQQNSGTTGGNSVFAAVGGKGVINIKGGTITSDRYGVHTMTTGTPVINISGGTITAPVALKSSTNGGNGELATINVTGGTINGTLETYTNNGKIVVSGGTFSNAVEEKYCAEGFMPAVNADGTFGVEKAPVASINGTKYTSLAEAINAAEDGATVQLLAGTIDEYVAPWATDSQHKSEKSITIVGAEDFGTTLTGGLYLGYDDNGCREHTITIEGINFTGKGILVGGQQNVVIKNNKFSEITAVVATSQSANANAISVIGKNVNATVIGNVIAGVEECGIHLRDVINAEVTDNSVSNTNGNSITINPTKGSNGAIVVRNNTLSNWGRSREGRAMRISGGATVTINGNVMSHDNAPEELAKVTDATSLEAAGNYWNGESPVADGIFKTDVVAEPAVMFKNYYTDVEKTNLVEIAASVALKIVDGVDDSFVNESEKTVGTLTYTRTFNNLTWNALYVPFEIPMSELIESYDVAYINDVHSYDDDDNGDIDRMTMEVIKITDEEASLNANYPYLIRPKNDEAKALNLELTDTKVYVAEENTIDVTSTSLKFDIKGSYNRRKVADLSGSLVMGLNSTGIASWITMSQGTLNPFRLILTITNRTTTSPVKLSAKATKAIRIHTRGENEETTDIENLNSEQMSNDIYDLQGRRVINPTKGGLYIINGKKVIL